MVLFTIFIIKIFKELPKLGCFCTILYVPVFASFYRFFPLSWQKYFLPWQKPNPDIYRYDVIQCAKLESWNREVFSIRSRRLLLPYISVYPAVPISHDNSHTRLCHQQFGIKPKGGENSGFHNICID